MNTLMIAIGFGNLLIWGLVAVAIFLVYRAVLFVVRWVRSIRRLFRIGARKTAFIQILKAVLLVGVFVILGIFIKYIIIAGIVILVAAISPKGSNVIYGFDAEY